MTVATEGLAPSRITALRCIARSLLLPGEFWECGVYLGNNAALIKSAIGDRVLRLFDTFSECPPATPEDHGNGARVRWPWKTSLDLVRDKVGGPNVHLHQGVIPQTFAGLEDAQIAFAYVDLTLYAGTKGALEFIWPRVVSGGSIFVRDYYGSTEKWRGLVQAVDECGLTLERHDYDAVVHKP